MITVNGQTVVDYDGIHAAGETRTGTVSLPVGAQQVVVTYFEKTGFDSLLVDIAGPQLARTSLSNVAVSPSLVDQITPVDPVVPVVPADNAVSYEYYQGNWTALPDFDALTPVLTGQQNDFSLAPATRSEDSGFRFTTQISIPVAGEYTFYLSSDDGSAITVNGQTIVDYDGLHSARTRSGSVNLATGTQQVVVTYFERAGQNSLNVEIAGPQLARTELANLVGF